MKIEGYGEVPDGLVKGISRKEYKTERNKEYRSQAKSDLRFGRFFKGMLTRLGAVKGFATVASAEAIFHTVEYVGDGSSSFSKMEIAALAGGAAVGALLSGKENVREGEADDVEIAAMRGVRPDSSERPPDVPR